MATSSTARSIPAETVQAIRGFNRFYTHHIGLLEEGLLDSDLSLTECRTLYELAHRDESTAAELGRDLNLDAGYLSRILRKFEKRRWIEKSASPNDGRQSLLRLTKAGWKTFKPLDARSSEQVGAIVANLSPAQLKDLVGALQRVEFMLGSGALKDAKPEQRSEGRSYRLRQHRPGDMGWVVFRHGVLYSKEYGYDERFEAMVAGIVAEFVEHYKPAREHCWMAEIDGELAGSVFLVERSNKVAKLRLLLVEPSARGMGIGKRLVAECIRFARKAGYKTMMLWTQSELTAARRIYQQAGFELMGEKRHDSWGRTNLVAETWRLKL